MKYSSDDRIDAEVKRLVAAGWTVAVGGKHAKVVSPAGLCKPIPKTPSCNRAGLNWVHELRRLERNGSPFRHA